MNVMKVVELVADSPDGWKDAIEHAVLKASETIRNINAVEVTNLSASVHDGRVIGYKADLQLSFLIEDH